MSLWPTELHENGVSGAGRSMAGATLEFESVEVFGLRTPDVPIIGPRPGNLWVTERLRAELG